VSQLPIAGQAQAATPGPADWDEFRRQMPVARRWAYLDHAAVSPLPKPAAHALAGWAAEAALQGAVPWPKWNIEAEQARAATAQMLHARPEEIALIHNTTEGIGLVAEGYPWQPGDNAVILEDEFPSNQYPWLNLASRGVETRRVPVADARVDLDRLAAACDRRTRVVSISWGGYATGWRNDLAAAAEIVLRSGALLFVDAIQALGVFPLDVRQTPVDFLAADGHKWLLGPEGAGVFFIRQEHLERLRPLGVGWNSVVASGDFSHIELNLKPTAARYEGGSQNTAGMIALKASIELLGQFGAKALATRILELTDLACDRLRQAGAVVWSRRVEGHSSGIVSFELPGRDPRAVRRRCLEQAVVLSCRNGRLRISPHAYNTPDDIDRLIAALRKVP